MEHANEVLAFRKATASNYGNSCVELADGGVVMRDSKDSDGARLYFTRGELAAFFDGVRRGEFDHLLAPSEPPSFSGAGVLAPSAFGDLPADSAEQCLGVVVLDGHAV
jgi:hypothetical protein